MPAAEWGRNEATLWPRRGMVRTIGAAFLSLVLCGGMAWLKYAVGMSDLQRFYLPIFIRTAAGFSATSSYRLLMIANQKGQSRVALESDLAPGLTEIAPGKWAPFGLSEKTRADGLTNLFLQSPRLYRNRPLHEYLSYWVYGQHGLTQLFAPAILGSLAIFALSLFYTVPLDIKRRRELRYGRRLKGPELLEPGSFQDKLLPDGIGFRINGKPGHVAIPRRLEDSHMLIIGDNGTGKSSLIRQVLLQVRDRGEAAIVYDPALEYVTEFYSPERGDIILNPLDARMPFWKPGDELEDSSEALAMAESLFPQHEHENPFFVEGPRKIFAHLLSYRPTATEIAHWMSNPKEIEKMVEGTELEPFIDPKAPAQRNGILSSLNMVADACKCLPAEFATKTRWTARQWADERRGWIFLTSRPVHRKKLLPLISLWLDMLVLRLMSDRRRCARRVWFVLDELASLQRLPQLHTAITENRKSGNPLVLGFHGRSQLEARYGRDAETMLSQPATKLFLRTSEARAAEWISEMIGKIEVERLRESHHRGLRDGRDFSLEKHVEPLVMASEISGLGNLRCYMKFENYVTRFAFPYIELPKIAEDFLARGLLGMAQPASNHNSDEGPTPPIVGEQQQLGW